MTDLTRYHHAETEMEDHANGDFVRFEDFDRLQKQLAEAERQFQAMVSELIECQCKLDEANQRIAELSRPSPGWLAMRKALHEAEIALVNSLPIDPNERPVLPVIREALKKANQEHPAK